MGLTAGNYCPGTSARHSNGGHAGAAKAAELETMREHSLQVAALPPVTCFSLVA